MRDERCCHIPCLVSRHRPLHAWPCPVCVAVPTPPPPMQSAHHYRTVDIDAAASILLDCQIVVM
jgi:hypothetical protein